MLSRSVWLWAILSLSSPVAVQCLELAVVVHYPEKNSPVDLCGFQFHISTSVGDPDTTVQAYQVGNDTFTASLEISDELMYEEIEVGVLASFSETKRLTNRCQEVCHRIGPQGLMVMFGPYPRTGPLAPTNRMDLWPSFCKEEWDSFNTSFYSMAIGKKVNLVARMPGAVAENPQPRPSSIIPPVMFRLNPEWQWPDNSEVYSTWHDLMMTGRLNYFVIVEVYVDGITWESWNDQPIFTGSPLYRDCTANGRSVCDNQTQFVCDAWSHKAYYEYIGGNHSYGSAAAFFDELYEDGLPGVMHYMPRRADDGTLRVGAWGYCIGGLGAWSAMLLRPNRFNLGYIGSPALDFDCGETLRAADAYDMAASPVRPKIFIDSGAGEGMAMNRMAKLLSLKLQRRGMVEGIEIFYERLPFGTHQQRSLLRRAQAGVFALFGASRPTLSSSSAEWILERYPANLAAQQAPKLTSFLADLAWAALVMAAFASVFLLGRRSARRSARTHSAAVLGSAVKPLLGA